MKQWLLENLNWLVPCVASLFGGSSVCTIVSLIKTAHLSKAISKARESKYWTTCPHCKKKVYLEDLAFHMPDGALDDNLNGKPDDQE